MDTETEIALRNYDALIRAKGLDRVALDWDAGTVTWGDGGVLHVDVLLEPGFTSGTQDLG
ncbi:MULTISPECIES: hypothetical protein [unclassified Agrococcus]|uniref:hypothetical protein n=1 Tax=unclassified Agrococcus TaxID=2615065 RepID=UPI003606BDF6